MGGFLVQRIWMYKVFWLWTCYNSSYLLNYCMFNDSYGFSNKMQIQLLYLCPPICLFHHQKLLKYNVGILIGVCCIYCMCCLSPAVTMVNMFHYHWQCDRMTFWYCLYASLIILITTQKPHDPVNLKQTFYFTANGKNKERETDGKKGKKKERGNISETFYSNSGV